jgi:DtxR family Mn-dependent transcriptional regulator
MASHSTAEQDYLKQIYLLQQDLERATTQMLVKPSSVTSMIKRLLEDEGGPLVRHTPYHGVELTERGVAVALEMLRHHRLIETFLVELLGVPWHQVHEEAERLEHVLSEDLEERIAAKLGNPRFDPHGDPIPSREGVMPSREVLRLTELPPGTSGTIARIERQEQEVLEYLASLGLVLNAHLKLKDISPFGGVVTLHVGAPKATGTRAIGKELADHILVAPSTGEAGRPESVSEMNARSKPSAPARAMIRN